MAVGVQPAHGSNQPLGRFQDDRSRARRGARRGRARMREVVIDLPAHPIDLLANRGSELALAGSGRAFGVHRQQRQRCLETVCKVAGRRDRALHGPLALIDQRVQIVDEWLHLRHIAAFQPCLAATVHVGQPRPELRDARQPAAHLPRTAGHRDARDHKDEEGVRGPDEMDRATASKDREVGEVLEHVRDDGEREQDESDRPQSGAEQDPCPQREHHAPIRYPRPRTVSISDGPSFRRSRATNTSTVFESRSKSCA